MPDIDPMREPINAAQQGAPLKPGFMRPKEAATYLGISMALLAKQNRLGTGPKQYRVGRAVLYKRDDLNAWMESL